MTPAEGSAFDWSPRGAAYAASAPHRAGPSLAPLVELAAPRPGDRAVDVGTGAGHTAAALAARGARVTGVDPAEGMLASARARYGGVAGLDFAPGRGDALPVASGSVDLVTARHTLHHHRDAAATLREVARALRPGGRFAFVDEVALEREAGAWYHELERSRDPSHVGSRTLDAWRALLTETGFVWIVGDARIRYPTDVAAWIARTDPEPAAAARTRALLREAPAAARAALAIRTDEAGEATRFEMPMALVLAVKPAPPLEATP